MSSEKGFYQHLTAKGERGESDISSSDIDHIYETRLWKVCIITINIFANIVYNEKGIIVTPPFHIKCKSVYLSGANKGNYV